MKKIVIIASILVMIAFLGNYTYNYMVGFASDKVIEHVVNDLLDEQLIEELLSDPAIEEMVQSLVNEKGNTNTNKSQVNLPFTTKEEGVKVVLTKFSLGEMKEIATQVQGGLSTAEQYELANQLKERLTEAELEALMIIGVAELQKEISKKTQ